jgi:bifunctional non-homologous end joining protein LigD
MSTPRSKPRSASASAAGGEQRPFPELAPPIFVVQKHRASRLHYDFRLEIGGVLVSWAVPKGPSLSPRERRLAVQTEDHPLGYAAFEGKIPPGNYGAGTVIVWDYGRWEMQPPEADPERALREGALKFVLRGRKLRGRWALVRMKGRGAREWLLIKEHDAEARAEPPITDAEPRSALSGRTLEEVERDPHAPVLSCADFG